MKHRIKKKIFSLLKLKKKIFSLLNQKKKIFSLFKLKEKNILLIKTKRKKLTIKPSSSTHSTLITPLHPPPTKLTHTLSFPVPKVALTLFLPL